MTATPKRDELHKAIIERLPIIDRQFDAAQIPISNRASNAAVVFVEDWILDIKGDTFDNYFVKPWFKRIWRTADEWYRKKYGPALSSPDRNLTGIILIDRMPYLLKIPSTLTQPGADQGTAWLIFPVDLQDFENPLDWIIRPPVFSEIGKEKERAIRNAAALNGYRLRSITNNLRTAVSTDDVTKALIEHISHHLEIAAANLGDTVTGKKSIAIWDAHQSVEKILKFLIRQKGEKPKKIHDLQRLLSAAVAETNETMNELILKIPNHSKIIRYRSGELGEPSLEMAFVIYETALTLVYELAKSVKKRIIMDNARLLIRSIHEIMKD